ncbi:hypothetical protein KQX54_013035 [Cotesia glomerata]|uniref:Uncharacterized protein n=1 Tax=Cotesia glomerata TaxID=32391 RepID=A0AAV7J4E8_COTGL|nr:hypothetical protein KQX54_013035 [Cotesia glomerata]
MTMNNTKIKLTSNAEIEKFRPGTTCQLVGYVDAIESPKRYNTESVFKFILNNGTGLRVQVNCWNKEIPRTQREIVMVHVIHLESAGCVADSEFNNGNYRGAQISVRKYTCVENLGKFDPETHEAAEIEPEVLQLIPLNAFENSVFPWKFKTIGYVKTKLTTIKAENANFTKGFFSITDG